MPFTVSHLAAVLPLRSGRTRVTALPTAPLVVGSMVPDLPAILGASGLRPATHDPLAAVTLDVGLTLAVVLVWRAGVRQAVAQAAPSVAARWAPAPPRRRAVLWWYAAAALGSLTHLLWDGLTHSGEGAALWFPELAGHDRLFLALQLASSVLGLGVLLLWTVRWWQRTADLSHGVVVPRVRVATALAVGAVCTVACAALRGVDDAAALRDGRLRAGIAAGDFVFGALSGVLLAALLLGAAYWVERGLRAVSAGDVEPRPRVAEVEPR